MIQEVSTFDLHLIINKELSKLEECPGCRVRDIFLDENAGSSDCNWEIRETRCADHHISDKCKHVVDQVVSWAKVKYKLSY